MQTTNVVKLLARFPVFSKLSHQEQERLALLAVRRSFQKGEFVAHSGYVWPYVIIIDYGEIHALKMSPAGRSFGTMKLQAGEEFWSPSLFTGIPLPATLEVWKPSAIYFLQQEHVLPLVQKNTAALWELSIGLAQRLHQKSELIEEIAFSSIAGRLARLLLDQFDVRGDLIVGRDLSLDEMGAIIGTTSVMVCKQIYRFAENGLINVSRTDR
jgi:CRP-like cAMP-binding protein